MSNEVKQPNEGYATFEDYEALLNAKGEASARSALERGDRVILGMRVENNTYDAMAPDNPRTKSDESRAGTGVYDDRIVVLWKDKDGQGRLEEFNRANTEPSAQYDVHAYGLVPASRKMKGLDRATWGEGEDVNGDKKRDVGRLTDGTIEMFATTHDATKARIRVTGNPVEFALRPTPLAIANGQGGVVRDSNGDGWFTASDPKGVDDLNRTFKIHPGSVTNTDSAGCQTIHPADYDRFVNTIRANPEQTRWQYVLTTVDSTMFKDVQTGAPKQDSVVLDPSGRGLHGRSHPDHALFKSILGKVQEEDRRLGRASDDRSENLAGALTVEAKKKGIQSADQLYFSADGSRAIVTDALDSRTGVRRVASVDTSDAINMPLQNSEAALRDIKPKIDEVSSRPPQQSMEPALQPSR